MANTVGIYVEGIETCFWRNVRVTADGSGIATATFAQQIGTKNYLLRVSKTTAPTLVTAIATPQYSGPSFIPSNKQQSIPVDTSQNSEATLAVFPLDPVQSFQIYLTGLDAAGVYDVSVATNYSYGTC